MRLLASLLLASVNVVLIALALYVRAGNTWVLSGEARVRVGDEERLGRWCGNALLAIGGAGVVAAGLLVIAPDVTKMVIAFYVAAVCGGVWIAGRGCAASR